MVGYYTTGWINEKMAKEILLFMFIFIKKEVSEALL
jgi:hypothetical protein